MITKYRKCACKQDDCTLKYQYRNCKYVEHWQLFQKGTHPFVQDKHINTKPNGLGLKIIELIQDLLEANPDMKPSSICSTITKRRNKAELTTKQNALNLIKNSNYETKSVNNKYLFDKNMLPPLRKVFFLF